jgi:L-ascorbate metabolism protein UlaG (beta-lactamase superfamily)
VGTRILFGVAAAAMTVDALGYTFGAIRPIERGLAPAEPYWRKRLRLNLLFANHGQYVSAAVAWLAVALYETQKTASAVLGVVALLSALYSVVTVPLFTRSDAAHILPRGIATVAYLAAFVIAFLPPVDAAYLQPQPGGAPLSMAASSAGAPLRVTRVMHASVLVESGTKRILTDPWLSARRHYHPGESLGVDPKSLAGVSLVTSGQDHYDHSDFEALRPYVSPSTPIVVPSGTAQRDRLLALGFTNVRALSPWESFETDGIKVTAVPARSGVQATDFDYELAYVYELEGRTAFFAAHRVSIEVAREVQRRFPHVDVAFLTVNDLRVRPQLMKQLSMSPADAADVAGALGASVAVPIHYRYHGSWVQDALLLSHEGTPEAFSDMLRERAPRTSLLTLAPGQPLTLSPQVTP